MYIDTHMWTAGTKKLQTELFEFKKRVFMSDIEKCIHLYVLAFYFHLIQIQLNCIKKIPKRLIFKNFLGFFFIIIIYLFIFPIGGHLIRRPWPLQGPEVVTFLLCGRLIGRSPSPPMKGRTVSHPYLTWDSNPVPQVQQSAPLSITPVGRLFSGVSF